MITFLRTHFPAFFTHPLPTELEHTVSEKRRQLIQTQLRLITELAEQQKLVHHLQCLQLWQESLSNDQETVFNISSRFDSIKFSYQSREEQLHEVSSNPSTLRKTGTGT